MDRMHRFGEMRLRIGHQGRVRSDRDGQSHHAPRAPCSSARRMILRKGASSPETTVCPGQLSLAHHQRALAPRPRRPADVGLCRAGPMIEDHAAWAQTVGRVHDLGALADQPQRIVEVDRARGEHRRDLSHAVPRNDLRRKRPSGARPLVAQRLQPRDRGNENRRLRVRGLVELIRRAVLDQMQQVIVEDLVGTLEPLLGIGGRRGAPCPPCRSTAIPVPGRAARTRRPSAPDIHRLAVHRRLPLVGSAFPSRLLPADGVTRPTLHLRVMFQFTDSDAVHGVILHAHCAPANNTVARTKSAAQAIAMPPST